MKKIQFYLSASALACLAILAVLSFFICAAGFIFNTFHNVDLGALSAFDVVFWLSARILAPVVRECYADYKEDVITHPENYIK